MCVQLQQLAGSTVDDSDSVVDRSERRIEIAGSVARVAASVTDASCAALGNMHFWVSMIIAAVLGVLIRCVVCARVIASSLNLSSIATFMQINYTSALTNNISGTVKVDTIRCACVCFLHCLALMCALQQAALQTVLAIVWYGNAVTFINTVGLLYVSSLV
jgi:hypothetical protein